MADRTASTVWKGDLPSGTGRTTFESSGLASDVPVSWPARTEEPDGQTSPEELIAAAHSACFSMAFANQLAKRGAAPERMETSATVTFIPGTGITRSALTVRATVPDADDALFREALAAAEEGCPVSGALRGNVEIPVDAQLV